MTSPIDGRVSWLKYHIKHFDTLDVRLLTKCGLNWDGLLG
jgi:hypothetical protein